MFGYFHSSTIEQLDAARFFLEVLFVLCGVGVAFGVAIEKDRFDLGWKVLVASLGMEIVFTVLIFNSDEEINRRQKTELAETQQRTEELRADNLALQQAMRPRHLAFNEYTLSSKTVTEAYEQLKAFRGTVALIQPVPDFEASVFARDIENTLNYLGWSARIVDGGVTHLPDLAFVDGVTIFLFPDTNGSANKGAALQKAIRVSAQEQGDEEVDVAPVVLVANGQKGYPYLDPPVPGAVLIRIGVRQFSPAFLDIQNRALERDVVKGSQRASDSSDHNARTLATKPPVFLQGIPTAPGEPRKP
jgi:hypothetical protein